MRTTVWIAGDQLTPGNSALRGLEPEDSTILMIESLARGRERPYHKRRLVLIFAAMRGFADDLRTAGWHVDYFAERDDYAGPLAEHVAAFAPERMRMMTLADYGGERRPRQTRARARARTRVFPERQLRFYGG